jgi:hypothetical protein
MIPKNARVVISLCDLTGNAVKPWVEAGYHAFLVDPQHITTRTEGNVTKFAGTIADAMPVIGELIRTGNVAFVMGWPPCTDLAVSGARWFQRKMHDPTFSEYRGPNMWIDAMRIVEQCRVVGELSGAPYFVENPKTRISTLWRKPDHKFDPWHFTAWEPKDNYTKDTWLWTNAAFIMPQPAVDMTLGAPDKEFIHHASPTKVKGERGNKRSITPMGFARAVFDANHRPALEVAA